jgi:hypothetical protein
MEESLTEKDSRPLDAGALDAGAAEGDPFRFAPIVRLYGHGGTVLDLRTGHTASGRVSQQMFFAALPLPPELNEAQSTSDSARPDQ